jgi:hypothetical protein
MYIDKQGKTHWVDGRQSKLLVVGGVEKRESEKVEKESAVLDMLVQG